MAENEVPVVQTIPTALAFAGAVIVDWVADMSSEDKPLSYPPKEAVAVLYAQYMMETGGLNCYGWNIGNVKHVTGDGYDYQCLHGVWEGVSQAEADQLVASGQAVVDPNLGHQSSCSPKVSVVFNPPHPATRFRVYSSLADAMRSHFILMSKGRYASCWPFVIAGDVNGFAQAIHDHGYMTASAQAYAHGMAAPFAHFMASKEYDKALAMATPQDQNPTLQSVEDQPVIHPSIEFEPIVYNFDDLQSDKEKST